VSPVWKPGYCPICGGWPTLAEACGLERSRQHSRRALRRRLAHEVAPRRRPRRWCWSLDTVELDIIALEHGYSRPERPATV
jgi:hypothetical protein